MSMTGSGFGYGQGTPDDSSDDLNVIAFICQQMIERLDIMKLVQVQAVHPGTGMPPAAGTVDVLPLVNQIDGNGYPTPHGTVSGISYWRFQAGNWAIIADPAVGDIGYVVCADRDSSTVVNTQAQANPGSRRRYNLADGIYIGGVLNAVPAATIWLKPDGTLVITDKSGNVIQTTTTGINFGVGGQTVLSLTSNLATLSVKLEAPDFETPGLPSYGTHKHTQADDSGGNTEQETSGPVGGT